MMKVGCETIIFGSRIDNLEYVLKIIANAGFTGVEFFQRPNMIFVFDNNLQTIRNADIEDIASCLKKENLAFLGLAGGTLKERVEFCNKATSEKATLLGITVEDCRPLYLYVEDCTASDLDDAAAQGFIIAFHPHVYMKYERVGTAKSVFNDAAEYLFWMPDTAHMYVATENPIEEIKSLLAQKAEDSRPMRTHKVIAVHLKDWNAAYGRSLHRYAKGFVPLGKGDVPLKGVMDVLREFRFDGWIVVEQDYTHDDWERCLHESVSWLSKQGIMNPPNSPLSLGVILPTNHMPKLTGDIAKRYPDFLKAISLAGDENLEKCYQMIAMELSKLFDACHTALWSCNQAHDDMCLLAAYPPDPQKSTEDMMISKSKALISLDVDTLEAHEYDLESVQHKNFDRTFYWSRLAKKIGAQAVVSIPIPNRYNPHQVRLLIGLMQQKSHRYDYTSIAEAIAYDVARAADAALDDACAYVVGKVNFLAGEHTSLDKFLSDLKQLIQEVIDCEGLTIFIENMSGERLEEKATTGIDWTDELGKKDHCYHASDVSHPTTQCWKEGKTILIANALNRDPQNPHKPKSRETVPPSSASQDNILLIPFVSVTTKEQGQHEMAIIGVVRCRNKRTKTLLDKTVVHPFFTDDEAALLSAICQAAVPHIQLLQSDAQRDQYVSNLSHELVRPVTLVRAAVDSLSTYIKTRRAFTFPQTVQREDFASLPDIDKKIEDILSLTAYMAHMTETVHAFSRKTSSVQLQCEATNIVDDVLKLVLRQLSPFLVPYTFSISNFEFPDPEMVPGLYIDRYLFQSVFFNLFDNAVKNAWKYQDQFRVSVHIETDLEWCRIVCRDQGRGIDEHYKETIFDACVRTPDAIENHPVGSGLGLWYVRRIIREHGGKVEVTNCKNPTEITLFLPAAAICTADRED